MPPVNDASAGMPTLGRYVLAREIARSNDIVWEATDPQMNRRVAIKELSLPGTLGGSARGDRISRFYREARAAGAMSHPNIVTIHEVGESDGRYFIVMEYLEGRTLRERLNNGALPLAEILTITTALCDALEYAHARGVIHRDIKPDNVHLLPDGRVKLTDFGIARITHEDSLTMDGQVFGTPSYMSPEQITGKPIDARTDIFSLGILLCEMLTGKKPFTGDSVVTITYRILNDDLPALVGVPPALEAVIRRATAKESEQRFASAAELRAALLAATGVRGGTAAFPARTLRSAPAVSAGGGPASDHATILASGRTHVGRASDVALDTTPPAQDVYEGPAAAPLRILPRVLVALLVVVLLLGGAWTLSRAYQRYTLQNRRKVEWTTYEQARKLYEAHRYEPAIEVFQRLRGNSVDPNLAREATLALAYCYLGVGNRFYARRDYTTTERWYRAANELAPDDPHVRQAFKDLLDRIRAPEGVYPPAAGTPAAPGSAPAASPGRSFSPPPSAMSGADFQSANARRAAEAQRLLDLGNAAWGRRDRDGALRLWGRAEQAGPGSPAALTARARINAVNAGGVDAGAGL